MKNKVFTDLNFKFPILGLIIIQVTHQMTSVARPDLTLRHIANLSKRFFSSMNAPKIVLPYHEIDQLWFGGLNLQPGNTPSEDVMKRWFKKDTKFDTACG